MAPSVLNPEEIVYLDRILALIRDPQIDEAGERNVLAAMLATAQAQGALRKQAQLERVSGDMNRVLSSVQEAAKHDQLAAAFLQVAHQQGGNVTGEMVANLIAQLVKTRAELIDMLQGQYRSGLAPTMVFGHLPPTSKAVEDAFQSYCALRGGSGERGAFQLAVAQLLQSEPEKPAPASAS